MTINTQKLLADRGSISPLSPMRLERLEARALQQLDYSGPGSRGKSIYVGANEVLELVSAARALTDAQAVFDAQTAEVARLREALTAIEQWEVPLVESRGEAVSMSVAYGSNGVRDYFRGVARAALSGESHD